MKTYKISRESDGVKLYRLEKIGHRKRCYEILPEVSLKVANLSPNDFEFGYGGWAPGQLALAILLDAFDSLAPDAKILALEHYKDFTEDFIAPQHDPSFQIKQEQIIRWHSARIAIR